MTPSTLPRFELPVQPYRVAGYHFGQRLRRRVILWATHLGDDVVAAAGTPVCAIGVGEVVWSEMRLGSKEKRNWGGIVIVRHKYQEPTTFFYSLYGHITDLRVKRGEHLVAGQPVGVVAPGNTPENGMWAEPHLHFALYTGPWRERVLPGYSRPDDWLRLSPRRTRLSWWHNPTEFIERMNQMLAS